MSVKRKRIIGDTGSALLREAVRQMNESIAPISTQITATNGTPVYVPIGVGGLWIVNIKIAVDDAGTFAAATSGFKIQSDTSGKWASPTTHADRTDFDTTAVASGALVDFNDLTADTSTGELPIWIEDGRQARLLITNNEGADRVVVVHVQVRPAEYEIQSTPQFNSRLQNFSVKE